MGDERSSIHMFVEMVKALLLLRVYNNCAFERALFNVIPRSIPFLVPLFFMIIGEL